MATAILVIAWVLAKHFGIEFSTWLFLYTFLWDTSPIQRHIDVNIKRED